MHFVLLQGKSNLPPARLFNLILSRGDLTVITEEGASHSYGEGISVRYVADTRDVGMVRRELIDVMRSRQVDRLLTPFERHQSLGGYLRELLGLPGRSFTCGLNVSSKFSMKQSYQTGGIPTSAFGIAHTMSSIPDVADSIGWPIVIKPTLGGGASNVVVLRDRPAFDEFKESDPRASVMVGLGIPFIVEKFVDMIAEFHCDGVVIDGEVVFAAASRYLQPLLGCRDDRNGSTLLPSTHEDAKAMFALHARAVSALDLRDSVTHMEFFKTREGWLAGEIAGRVAGGGIPEAIMLRHGVDLWAVDVALACGSTPAVMPLASEDYVINLLLPARPGVIKEISSAQDFADLPEVLKVDIANAVGNRIGKELHSSSSCGTVYLGLTDEADIEPTVQRVMNRFKLRVESD